MQEVPDVTAKAAKTHARPAGEAPDGLLTGKHNSGCIRHAGYVGGLLFTESMGLMLGWAWATLPQLFACPLLVRRTALEYRTLQAELPGPAEHSEETHYRLLPGVW